MADLMNNMNMDILKVPLGFIRVLEIPLVIIAFASISAYKVDSQYESSKCGGNPVKFTFAYPFKLTELKIPTNSCTIDSQGLISSETRQIFHENYNSQGTFFVAVGVLSLIYILGILFVYLFKWGDYEMDRRFAMIDFSVTAVLTLFWFAGTIAWAAALTGVKIQTNYEALENQNVAKVDKACVRQTTAVVCKFKNTWGYSGLTISVIAGFGCLFVFIGNLWFIWKETEWHKNRQGPPPQAGGDYPGGPPAPTSTDPNRPYP